jgi:hypothetical protein
MSPVAGVGISLAIQNAVAASNILGPLLWQGVVDMQSLASVQRRREWRVRIVQSYQRLVQHWLMGRQPNGPVRILTALRLQATVSPRRDLAWRIFGLGVWPVRLDEMWRLRDSTAHAAPRQSFRTTDPEAAHSSRTTSALVLQVHPR